MDPVKTRLGPLWWYAGLIFVANRIGDLLVLYVGTFLIPSHLTQQEMGAIEPLTRLTAFGALPLAVLGLVGTKYLSTYHARGELGKIKRLLRDMAGVALVTSALAILVCALCFDALKVRLHLQGTYIFIGVLGLVVQSCWQPILGVMLQGMQCFKANALSSLTGSTLKWLLALLLIPAFHLPGYLCALMLAGLGAMAVGATGLKPYVGARIRSEPYYDEWREIVRFLLPIAIYLGALNIQIFVEPLVIQHWLPAQDAAGYFLACRFGYIPTYLVGSLTFVMLPLISHRHEQGNDTDTQFRQAFGATLALGAAGVLIMYGLGDWILSLTAAWRPYQPYAPCIWRVGLIVILDALITVYAYHEIARRKLSFVWITAPAGLAQAALLYVTFGWNWFQGRLPPNLWQAVANILQPDLYYVLGVMICTRALTLAGVICVAQRSLKSSK